MGRLKDASDKDVALLLKTFATLEMLKLRLKMKPAPKPIDVQSTVKKSLPMIEAPEEPN